MTMLPAAHKKQSSSLVFYGGCLSCNYNHNIHPTADVVMATPPSMPDHHRHHHPHRSYSSYPFSIPNNTIPSLDPITPTNNNINTSTSTSDPNNSNCFLLLGSGISPSPPLTHINMVDEEHSRTSNSVNEAEAEVEVEVEAEAETNKDQTNPHRGSSWLQIGLSGSHPLSKPLADPPPHHQPDPTAQIASSDELMLQLNLGGASASASTAISHPSSLQQQHHNRHNNINNQFFGGPPQSANLTASLMGGVSFPPPPSLLPYPIHQGDTGWGYNYIRAVHHHQYYQPQRPSPSFFGGGSSVSPSASSSSGSVMPGQFIGRAFGGPSVDGAGPSSNIMRVMDPPPRRPHSGIWFMLQASQHQGIEPFLPQVSRSFLRIKDGRMTVRLVMKYLANKLGLDSESEVEVTCRGQQLVPFLTLQDVRDNIWSSRDAVTLLPDSSTSDHVMVLHYGRASSS